MTATAHDPANPATWLARGRTAEHARALATAWADYPDPPYDAPLEAKLAQGRLRAAALKPVHDAITAEGERTRQATNFAHVAAKLLAGDGGDHDVAILRGRDELGFGWDEAYSYADGWYAAHAGWERRGPCADNYGRVSASRSAAYDRGFADGGGRADDLFDAARRANAAALRRGNQPPPPSKRIVARPRPSAWPQPTDAPRPTPWSRRLLILGECAEQAGDGTSPALRMFDGEYFRLLRACPGHESAAVAILTTRYGIIPGDAVVEPYVPLPAGNATSAVTGDLRERAKLAAIIASREFDDVLVAATDPYLAVVDAHAAAIPLCRTMERTRHTVILRRRQFRTWLARGVAPGQVKAAGHIRWGKVHAGLKGSLGEFTARYAGPLEPRGHAVVVELARGGLATGYADATGAPLDPRITVSNKAHLRAALTEALRTFAAATRFIQTEGPSA